MRKLCGKNAEKTLSQSTNFFDWMAANFEIIISQFEKLTQTLSLPQFQGCQMKKICTQTLATLQLHNVNKQQIMYTKTSALNCDQLKNKNLYKHAQGL